LLPEFSAPTQTERNLRRPCLGQGPSALSRKPRRSAYSAGRRKGCTASVKIRNRVLEGSIEAYSLFQALTSSCSWPVAPFVKPTTKRKKNTKHCLSWSA